jgi:mono/diheme cytochrome c family protein
LISAALQTALVMIAVCGIPAATFADENAPVDFDRDIRPLLSDNCFQCHGPDEAQRQADLRLDLRDGLFANHEGTTAVVPGDPAKSELFRRLTAGEEERMPPVDSGRSLTDEQIATVRRWIEQGAEWQQHWSFVPPESPPLPSVANTAWPRNAIDFFILSQLEAAKLAPSPEANKSTLIRRVAAIRTTARATCGGGATG